MPESTLPVRRSLGEGGSAAEWAHCLTPFCRAGVPTPAAFPVAQAPSLCSASQLPRHTVGDSQQFAQRFSPALAAIRELHFEITINELRNRVRTSDIRRH